jgi:hypothetical protein
MYTNTSEIGFFASIVSAIISVTNKTTAIHRPVTNITLNYTSPFTKIPWCNDRPISVYPSNRNIWLTQDIINCVMKLQWAMSNKNRAPFAVPIQSLTHQNKLSHNTTCRRSEHQFHTQFQCSILPFRQTQTSIPICVTVCFHFALN